MGKKTGRDEELKVPFQKKVLKVLKKGYCKVKIPKAFIMFTIESKNVWLKSQARCNLFLNQI